MPSESERGDVGVEPLFVREDRREREGDYADAGEG